MYLAFGFSYVEGGPWSDDGIKAIDRFVNRIERLIKSLLRKRDLLAATSLDPMRRNSIM